jgi:hypothetical protein
MKKVFATVVYPVDVEIMVPDDMSNDDVWEEIIKKADSKSMNAAPVLYKCSEPINKHDQKEDAPDSQESFFQFVLTRLQQAKKILDPAISVLPLLKPKAHPQIISIAHNNLCQAIDYLIASMGPSVEFLIQETWKSKSKD